MRNRYSPGLASLLSLSLSVSIAFSRTAAVAAPAGRGPPPAREAPEVKQYNALLDEAVSEYEARRYEEARALFKKAHEISPNARTLRGIGMASFELRDYVEALRALEGSQINKRRPLTSSQRQQVQSLSERARAFVGRFYLRLSPKDALVHADGSPAVLEDDGSLLLSFGRHLLTVDAPGKSLESREVNVIGGERLDLAFDLRPAPAAGVPGIRLTASAPPSAAPRRDEHRGGAGGGVRARWWLGGAGILAAGTVASYFWWRFQSDEVTRCDRAGSGPAGLCRNRGVLVGREQFALGALIGGAAGALALGTIGTIVWANGKKESPVAFACSPVSRAMDCEIRFAF